MTELQSLGDTFKQASDEVDKLNREKESTCDWKRWDELPALIRAAETQREQARMQLRTQLLELTGLNLRTLDDLVRYG